MPRSPLQRGPATDHYHDRLGVDQTSSGGGVSATDGRTTVDPATQIQFPPGTLSDLGGGVAGVGLLTQLVGPFHIAFETPELQNNGVGLLEVPAGSWLTGVAVVITESWLSSLVNTPEFVVTLVPGDPTQPWASGAGFDSSSRMSVDPTADVLAALPGTFTPVATVVDGWLLAAYYPDDSTPGGEADIYAIIATPIA